MRNLSSIANINLYASSPDIVVPFGTIERLGSFPPAVRPEGLASPNMLVVQGSFPSGGFDANQDLPVYCDIRFIQLAPLCPPVMMFILQVGTAVAHWFASMSDAKMWDLLENWDSYGMMAVAAKLDDGRVLFGTKEYTSDQELVRGMREAVVAAKEQLDEFFPKAMAIVQAANGIEKIATSSLPDIPVVQTAYMSTVRTCLTPQVVFPPSKLAHVQRYLESGHDARALTVDALKCAGFSIPDTADD